MKADLTTYITYPPEFSAETMTLQNVEVPDHPMPAGGLTVLYGRSAVALLSRAMLKARTTGRLFVTVKIEVDLGQRLYVTDRKTDQKKKAVQASLELLPRLKAINLRKLSANTDIERLVDERFRSYIQEEGSPIPHTVLPNFGLVAARPDLIDRLHQEPEFAHLGLIIYSTFVEGAPYQFATLFDKTLVAKVTTVPPRIPFKLELP